MKNPNDYNIHDIESLTEVQAAELASEALVIKDHNIYLVDFGGYFGYSCLVYRRWHHLYYLNDYELHHRATSYSPGKTRGELRDLYLKKLENRLFTDAEISQPLKSYDDYRLKRDFLHNHYGMQRDCVSIFGTVHTSAGSRDIEKPEYEKLISDMVYNPVSFAYYDPQDADFVKHHEKLLDDLEQAKQNVSENYEYMKSAFYYEMGNHEYHINLYQGDWDVLSVFGDVKWRGENADLSDYFDDLGFNDVQRCAYLDARKEFLRDALKHDWY